MCWHFCQDIFGGHVEVDGREIAVVTNRGRGFMI